MTISEERKFAFTIGGAFAILAFVLQWRGRALPMLVTGSLASAFVVLGLVAPQAIPPIRARWMKGAHALSRVTTPIILGVVYFIVITPTGLIRRALGHNPLRRKRSNGSSWVARERRAGAPADMKRQF